MGEHFLKCKYCGSDLDHFYYFCKICATPYKNIDDAVPKVASLTSSDPEIIRTKSPQVISMFWTFLIGVILSSILFNFSLSAENYLIPLVISNLILAFITLYYSIIYWPSIKAQFINIGIFNIYFALSLILLCAMLYINFAYNRWLISLSPDSEYNIIELLNNNNVNNFLIILTICVTPAIVEEISFRGLIQHWLTVVINSPKAIIISAGMFSIMHFDILSFPYLFLLGCLLGWIKKRTNSLYPPIILHFLHNYAVITILSKYNE